MLRKDSLSIVFNGDWNKIYIQPDWIAKNVFNQSQIEIVLTGNGIDVLVSYRCNSVQILPSQNQIIFSIMKVDESSIKSLCDSISRFFLNSNTPNLNSYGFNSEYEDNGESFAEKLDNMDDKSSLFSEGYEVAKCVITRTLKREEKIFNVECSLNESNINIHINEHHEGNNMLEEIQKINMDTVNLYLEECWKIVKAMGYEKEDE